MQRRYLQGQERILYDNESEFRDDFPTEPILQTWQDGQIGDWVRANDNSIQQILTRKSLKRGKYDTKRGTDYILTVAGTFFVNAITILDSYLKRNPYSFGGNYRDFMAQPITKREVTFARYISNGSERVKAYMTAFKTNNSDYADTRSGFLLSTERVQKMVSQQVQEAADETGISPKFIFENLKRIVDKNGDDRIVLKALDQAAEYIAMKTKTQDVQTDSSIGLLQEHLQMAMLPPAPNELPPELEVTEATWEPTDETQSDEITPA